MTRRALVVVLGDLDRSPRMRYHCKSLASNNYFVDVIASGGGLSGDRQCDELKSYNNIRQYLLIDNVDFKRYLHPILSYILKTIWQSLLLIRLLFLVNKPNVILLQNPPSIPTMPVLFLYSRLRGSKLIIDWHNYGYTILKLNFRSGTRHILVRIYKYLEFYFGQLADAGFCVSQAMQKDLLQTFKIKYPIYVLYDKPAELLQPFSWQQKHDFFVKIFKTIPEFGVPVKDDNFDWTQKVKSFKASPLETRFTKFDEKTKKLAIKSDRPALIMSSTSWTPDEDFEILFKALEGYDRSMKILHLDATQKAKLDYKPPSIVCVITGKGPLKDYWKFRIERSPLLFVEFILPWLEINDYVAMVASSDLGISLHQSSSGVDLPMKVVDMFGCGVPVLAYDYKTIRELVKVDEYGQTFKNHNELEYILKCVLSQKDVDLERYAKNLRHHYLIEKWNSNWNKVARPVFDNL